MAIPIGSPQPAATLNPRNVLITISCAGVTASMNALMGSGAGGTYNIEPMNPDITSVQGTTGIGAFFQTNNRGYRLTCMALQTDNFNSLMEAVRQTMLATGLNLIVTVIDINSPNIFNCTSAKIVGFPTYGVGTTVEDRSWVLECLNVDPVAAQMFFGGTLLP